MRVLIVEDEPNLRQQLQSTLEGAGYAVDTASDGEEGHFLGSTETYDAIVLDLGLPEIDGLTVLDRWRKEGRTAPVLVLTAPAANWVTSGPTSRTIPAASHPSTFQSPSAGGVLLRIL